MKEDTKIERIFWTFLRAGLSGLDCNLIGYGCVSDDDWKNVYKLAEEQGLIGVVFFCN